MDTRDQTMPNERPGSSSSNASSVLFSRENAEHDDNNNNLAEVFSLSRRPVSPLKDILSTGRRKKPMRLISFHGQLKEKVSDVRAAQ
jgi:hypothetical protein